MTYEGYAHPRRRNPFGDGSSSRIAKTLKKLQAGALPASTVAVRAFIAGGTGAECSGCDETITGIENAYYVSVRTAAEPLRFHVVCHQTWIRFKKPRLSVVIDRERLTSAEDFSG